MTVLETYFDEKCLELNYTYNSDTLEHIYTNIIEQNERRKKVFWMKKIIEDFWENPNSFWKIFWDSSDKKMVRAKEQKKLRKCVKVC